MASKIFSLPTTCLTVERETELQKLLDEGYVVDPFAVLKTDAYIMLWLYKPNSVTETETVAEDAAPKKPKKTRKPRKKKEKTEETPAVEDATLDIPGLENEGE